MTVKNRQPITDMSMVSRSRMAEWNASFASREPISETRSPLTPQANGLTDERLAELLTGDKRERIVLDTNVLISGLFSTTSTPARAVEQAIGNGQLVATAATLGELMTKLFSSKFDRYVPRERRDALLWCLGAAERSHDSRSSRSSRFRSRITLLSAVRIASAR